jgi:hypothetical protein
MMNFKRCLLALVIFIAPPAWAGWTYVTTSEGDDARYFLDYETLRKDGNVRRIWQLVNLPSNDKDGWGSVRSRIEYDCKNETSKLMSFTVFSENFSSGNQILSQDKEMPRKDIPPGSVNWTLFKEVCKR